MKNKKKEAKRRVVSFREREVIGEMLFDPYTKEAIFAIWENQQLTLKSSYNQFVPYNKSNPLLTTGTVLLPSAARNYESVTELIQQVQMFIHRYVDVSETFELITTHYVLLSWIYDSFDELPYLRVRGDFGSGKTRFLQTVGSLAYKSIRASGAASTAAIFHMLNSIGGTLVIDESDFYHSSEHAQIVKIFNNGNAKGFPVLRCERTKDKNFRPIAFNIYGPKIVASRGRFNDDALESRFFTEDIGLTPVRSDIPLSLPAAFYSEAQELRNQLLMFRFNNLTLKELVAENKYEDKNLSMRTRQLLLPLLMFMNPTERKQVTSWIQREQAQFNRDRGMEESAHVLTIINELFTHAETVGISDIRNKLISEYREHYDSSFTPKAIGVIVRTKLHLRTKRSHGVYVIPKSEKSRVKTLVERYGLFVN